MINPDKLHMQLLEAAEKPKAKATVDIDAVKVEGDVVLSVSALAAQLEKRAVYLGELRKTVDLLVAKQDELDVLEQEILALLKGKLKEKE
jgi:hypothetical protein